MWKSLETVEKGAESDKIDFALELQRFSPGWKAGVFLWFPSGQQDYKNSYKPRKYWLLANVYILYPICIHSVYAKKKRKEAKENKETHFI